MSRLWASASVSPWICVPCPMSDAAVREQGFLALPHRLWKLMAKVLGPACLKPASSGRGTQRGPKQHWGGEQAF
ncbi:hypothetical protein CapIbe_007409 [Capra ibex]